MLILPLCLLTLSPLPCQLISLLPFLITTALGLTLHVTLKLLCPVPLESGVFNIHIVPLIHPWQGCGCVPRARTATGSNTGYLLQVLPRVRKRLQRVSLAKFMILSDF